MSVALAAILCAADAGDISEELRTGGMWKKTRKELAAGVLNGVSFNKVDDRTLRVPRNGGLSLAELDIGDSTLHWKEKDGLAGIEMMIYNKGDDGQIPKEVYDDFVAKTIDTLDGLSGVKGKSLKASAKDMGVKLKSWIWEWEGGAARLDASSKGKKKDFAAEFIRLKLGPDKDALDRGGASDAVTRRDLKSHVKKEGSAVWLEGIPMVDQGQKGYCVPATVSRVFAYYGMDGIDQHALAQLCNSSGQGGTSYHEMQTALNDISRQFRFKVVNLDGSHSLDEMVAVYNKAAKKKKKAQLTGFDVGAMEFDPEVMLAARAGKPAMVKKWLDPIRKGIDAGQPVLWSVLLGIFPEEGLPQSNGGHMRLIIGYDLEQGVIYYSDSWGAGHERKKMPANRAAAITTARYLLKK